ncbi:MULTISPECIES: electron transfer flavoprotein subunit alpha/FixB family protein [Vibrio]|uniref:electron transfer flavoprotein subunit alpha/FixB family protein n=1 Tax=Vibrio TaxID=662 RepID=UPI0001B9588A|nr:MULTISPECIES: FAD-binding protein [Vibrio]EEX33433.1 electron transfer flavoprotein alpha subunit [Vibrio coralliilyticus ATCC BAA-450]MCM5508319.1 FAD-binding protein [Vibrio sp. SCSIO 43169]MDE3897025.1 FAD-binding protein [Vibrio sp. CC007]QFT38270.1 Electron transfer flavoprotein subunit alpha [Vibrio sp. THAF64]QGM37192.1 Electron transfer flavoprotein subunit alpha [Vibrio sp. THAF191d]
MNAKTLVIVEHDNQTLIADTQKALSAAASLRNEVSALVVGCGCQAVVDQVAKVEIVKEVLVADSEIYQNQLVENCAELVQQVGADFSHVFAPATTFGKNLMPRVAALLDVGQLSDVIEIVSDDTVIRPVYAGNALAKVKSSDRIKVITVRSSAFESVKMDDSSSAEIKPVDINIGNDLSELVERQKTESARPDLPAARVVVSGGRGLGSKENFVMVEQLADKLGGAIGASRAAVDAGFVSNDLQVGQTGKIVAPELYIAVGISGAIQHLAGMKDSKVIVAINSDPEAPIFQIADYGLVGDLFEILPELTNSI